MLEYFKTIELDKNSHIPLYTQLFEKIKTLIEDGILLPQLKLPSIRKLAELLDVNQITIVSAYKHLENKGFVYSKTGSGTFVSDLQIYESSDSQNTIINDELYNSEDISIISGKHIRINENTINFASATPTPNLFPVDNFKLAINEVLERDMGYAFDYQESQGFFPLRESISKLLKKDSIKCLPENLHIISGAQQGIDVISKAFLNKGDCVITESPTYTGAIAVFKSREANIVDIQLDRDGLNLNMLEYCLKKYSPKLIYTIPTFQNPTGYSYSNVKRKELLDLAEKYDTYIIEDSYINDLDFEKQNYSTLKSIDKYDRVIFIKSFSKIFMPGLRLGYIIVPKSFHNNIIEAKHTTDISTSGLLQRAFDVYIRKGFWNTHFQYMYNVYEKRYYDIISALDRNINGIGSYVKPGGGLNIWINLPLDIVVNNLFKRCLEENIVFAPGRIFYSSNSSLKSNNIRLSFASVYKDQIEEGIEKLCRIIGSMQKGKGTYRNLPIL